MTNFLPYLRDKFGMSGRNRSVRRGRSISDAATVARLLKSQRSRFDIGGVPVPIELETRNFLIAGSTGTGKSQVLMRALDAFECDGVPAIIADPAGEFCERFYNPERGDVIINPHDARSVSWSPLGEIKSNADIYAIAKSLIPDTNDKDKAWDAEHNYAQQFLRAVLKHCFANGLTNEDIFKLASFAPIEQLQQICAGTPAEPVVHAGNEWLLSSVRRSVADVASKLCLFGPGVGREAFSIRRHIVEERPGWIFITYQPYHLKELSRVIAACIDVASLVVLSLPVDLSRRIVFALEELPFLGKVQSIIYLLASGRKHGAVVFAGMQTIAPLCNLYGHDRAQALLACFGNWLALRVLNETADHMSRLIGEQEIELVLGNTSAQRRVVTQKAVLASEIQGLPDLAGYFNLAGPTPIAKVKIAIAPARKQAAAYEQSPPRVQQKPSALEDLL